jgi:flagellar hook protein FlgE
MDLSVSSSLSAMAAFQKKMDVTADNIANVLTDGFKKSRVTMQEASPNGVKAVVDRVETPGVPKTTELNGGTAEVESSNVDLAGELTDMIPTQADWRANLNTLKVQNDMLGSVLDILG